METIHRFKGLETGVAIVVFGPENEVNPETIRTYAYVGMSRAKYALFVMGTGEVKQFAGDSQVRSRPSNRI